MSTIPKGGVDMCLHCAIVDTVDVHGAKYGKPGPNGEERAHTDREIIDAISRFLAEMCVSHATSDPEYMGLMVNHIREQFLGELRFRYHEKTGHHLPIVSVVSVSVGADVEDGPAPGERKH